MAKMWKKTLALAMAAILLLSMAGCGEKGEPEQEQSVEEEQQLPEEEPQADADQDPQLPQFGEQIQEAREKNEDIIGWLKIDGEHGLFCIFPDRAGIDKDDICLIFILYMFKAVSCQNGSYDFTVCHIHLTAVGFNIEFFCHGLHYFSGCKINIFSLT